MVDLPPMESMNLTGRLAHISPQDVENNLRMFFRDKEGFSPNTLRDLLSVVKIYANWCVPRGYAWLPVSSENAREYLFWLKDEKGRAITTVEKHLAMLNMLMGISGLPKLHQDKAITLSMKKLRRAAAASGERVGQAIPFHLADLHVADRLYLQQGSLSALRNRAFLFVAYNTMLRISEIGRLRVRDIEQKSDNVTLFVAYTKTNTVTETIKQIAPKTAAALSDWLKASGLVNHPDAMIFSRIFKNGRVHVSDRPLSTVAIEKIFKDTWNLMGRSNEIANKGRYTHWSGHSCRVGATQDLSVNGATFPQILLEGGWKNTETAMRYLRHLGAIDSAVANMIK